MYIENILLSRLWDVSLLQIGTQVQNIYGNARYCLIDQICIIKIDLPSLLYHELMLFLALKINIDDEEIARKSRVLQRGKECLRIQNCSG